MPDHPPLDIASLRADTPGCSNLVHFNNAGSSLSPTPVMRALYEHLALEQRIGGYEAAAAAEAELQDFYDAFATLLGATAGEIAFVENATRAWDMAFYAIPLAAGDRVVTTETEYASNFVALHHRRKATGCSIEVIASNGHGEIDLEALEACLRRGGVKVVSLTHVPTQGGLVNPAAEVGRLARAHGALFVLDACQSVGQMAVNVDAIGCDILSGTGRKFLRGPRGTGFLYVRRAALERLDPPFLDLHAATVTADGRYEMLPDARRFENWESFVAGRIALARAVRYALDIGLDRIGSRVFALAEQLRNRLAELPGVRVTDLGLVKSGIVTFVRAGESAEAIKRRLAAARINVSVSPAAYAPLDLPRRGLGDLVRASVHYYNTDDEIDRFCAALGGR